MANDHLPIEGTDLDAEELAILDHTIHRAARNCYCGDSPAMQRLVDRGLMRGLGRLGWCPDPYFTITLAGRRAHQSAVEAGALDRPGPAHQRAALAAYRQAKGTA